MIRIVGATEAYLPQVLEIEQEAISPPWTEGALTGEIGREDGLFALAVEAEDGQAAEDSRDENARVAGFGIVRRASDEAELYQIAVREDCRRRGIADTLMQAILAYCRRHGVVSVYLEVRRSNAAAIRLYKKYGFKNEGRRKNYYSSPVEDAVIMMRGLNAD